MGELKTTNNAKVNISAANNIAIKKHNVQDVANNAVEHYRKTSAGELTIWNDNDMNVHYDRDKKSLYFHDSDKNGMYDIQDMTYADSQQTVIKLDENKNNVKEIQDKFKTEFDTQCENDKAAKTLRNTVPDGKIENFRQRPSSTQAADCWLLTGVFAINSTDKGEIFKKTISPKNQGADVTLLGTSKTYNITKDQLKNLPPNFVFGDADVKAIEVAVANHRLNVLKSGKSNKEKEKFLNDATVENPLKNGTLEEAFFLLAGKKSENYFKLSNFDKFRIKYGIALPTKWEEGVNPNVNFDPNTPLILKEKYPQRFAMGATFEKNNPQVQTGHAFAISKVDEKFVTLVDPYDSSKEIKVAKDEFLENVQSVTMCDLKKN